MGEINFFSKHTEKRNRLSRLVLLVTIVLILSVGVGGVYSINNYMKIKGLKAEIAAIDLMILNPKRVEAVRLYDESKKAYELVSVYSEYVGGVAQVIAQKDQINTDFYDALEATVPKDLYLLNLNVSELNMTISARAKDKVSIAAFENNLEALDFVERVYIHGISRSEGGENFVVNCLLKSGERDE